MKIIKVSQSQEELVVDFKEKRATLSPGTKSNINKQFGAMGDFFDRIPLDTFEDILEEHNIILLQEDGRKWSGMLIGGKECGAPGAEEQHATFDMAVWKDNRYVLAKCWLTISWCKMPSGKYEVIKYIS